MLNQAEADKPPRAALRPLHSHTRALTSRSSSSWATAQALPPRALHGQRALDNTAVQQADASDKAVLAQDVRSARWARRSFRPKAWLCRPGMPPRGPGGAHALEMALAAFVTGTPTRLLQVRKRAAHARRGARRVAANTNVAARLRLEGSPGGTRSPA